MNKQFSKLYNLKSLKIYFLLPFFILVACNHNKRHGKDNSNISDNQIGKVIKIVDGDTYDILIEGNNTIRIRMFGIDAPEKGMPYYIVAKNYLGDLCFKKNINIRKTDIDQHGRTVAKSYLDDGRELGAEMVKAGLAWHYKKYDPDDSILANLENRAKENRIGLWADSHPIAPWEIRKLHRQGISTVDSFANTNQ